MLRGLIVVVVILTATAAGAAAREGGSVERRSSGNGADLIAEDVVPGGPGDGQDGSGWP
jgi:hypothetical protein